jgi:hypothetical protein
MNLKKGEKLESMQKHSSTTKVMFSYNFLGETLNEVIIYYFPLKSFQMLLTSVDFPFLCIESHILKIITSCIICFTSIS